MVEVWCEGVFSAFFRWLLFEINFGTLIVVYGIHSVTEIIREISYFFEFEFSEFRIVLSLQTVNYDLLISEHSSEIYKQQYKIRSLLQAHLCFHLDSSRCRLRQSLLSHQPHWHHLRQLSISVVQRRTVLRDLFLVRLRHQQILHLVHSNQWTVSFYFSLLALHF